MESIQTITEANSREPHCFMVGGLLHGSIISKIMLDKITLPGGPEPAYIGYDSDGNKLFE